MQVATPVPVFTVCVPPLHVTGVVALMALAPYVKATLPATPVVTFAVSVKLAPRMGVLVEGTSEVTEVLACATDTVGVLEVKGGVLKPVVGEGENTAFTTSDPTGRAVAATVVVAQVAAPELTVTGLVPVVVQVTDVLP
jgi:hypothetical protein